MTTRTRRPTEEGTGVSEAGRRRAMQGRHAPDAAAGPPLGAGKPESWEFDATDETPRPVAAEPAAAAAVERATPTHVDPAPRPVEQGTPTEPMARPERSEPIRVISMKDHTGPRPVVGEPRAPLHVQLRALAEVAGIPRTPSGLGRLAPPRDARQARRRRRRANLAWACVALVLASGISLAIWLIAGR